MIFYQKEEAQPTDVLCNVVRQGLHQSLQNLKHLFERPFIKGTMSWRRQSCSRSRSSSESRFLSRSGMVFRHHRFLLRGRELDMS